MTTDSKGENAKFTVAIKHLKQYKSLNGTPVAQTIVLKRDFSSHWVDFHPNPVVFLEKNYSKKKVKMQLLSWELTVAESLQVSFS